MRSNGRGEDPEGSRMIIQSTERKITVILETVKFYFKIYVPSENVFPEQGEIIIYTNTKTKTLPVADPP